MQVEDRWYSFKMSVKTIADGFRFLKIDNNKKNVMVLGDSVTFGVRVDNGETYSDQLARLLKEKINIQNYGAGEIFCLQYKHARET